MRNFEEMTISEIELALGEPAGAVKSRLRRARELVREYLIGPPEEPLPDCQASAERKRASAS